MSSFLFSLPLLTWGTEAGSIDRQTLSSILTFTAGGAVHSIFSFRAGDRAVRTLQNVKTWDVCQEVTVRMLDIKFEYQTRN